MGPVVGGWIVVLPLVSGPVVFFLALDQGTSFAAAAAQGSLTGAVAQAGFCLAYGWSAKVGRWPLALAGGALGFALPALALQAAPRPPLALLVAIIPCCVVLTLSMMTPTSAADGAPASLNRWDIPTRMVTGTVAVVALTQAAPLLGPRFSGLLAAFPVITTVLAVFTHRAHGPRHANAVLRGLLLGVFSFVAFYAVLGITVERVGIGGAFAAASGAALLVHALTAAILRNKLGGRVSGA